MKKVAVTGGLSSGKSTFCKLLQKKGAYYVSADEIVHKLLSPNTEIGKKIITLLGEGIVQNGHFDKKAIAERVFENRETLRQLEQILHPAVLKEIEKQYNQVKETKKYTLFLAEVPLLYESESAHLFESVIAIKTDPSHAKKRLGNEKEFEKRITHQMPIEEKCARADFVIANDGTLENFKQQADTLYQQLTQ